MECSLLLSVDRDGFALGVVEAIHGLDVHHHRDSARHDRKENNDDEEGAPDGGREETDAVVPLVGEFLHFRFRVGETRLDLNVGNDNDLFAVAKSEVDAAVRLTVVSRNLTVRLITFVVVFEFGNPPSSAGHFHLHVEAVAAFLQVDIQHCFFAGLVESENDLVNFDFSFANQHGAEGDQEIRVGVDDALLFGLNLILLCCLLGVTCLTDERG